MPSDTIKFKGAMWTRTFGTPYEFWVMGVDPGGVADFTAVAAVHYTSEPVPDDFIVNEVAKSLKQKMKRTYRVHGLTRLPLGLTQPQQVDELQTIRSARPQLRGADLVFDATGLGAGISDAAEERGMRTLVRIIFSGGDEINKLSGGRISVPKWQLIGSLDGAVQNGELVVAPGVAGADLLIKEAETFKRAITAAGRSQFNARDGAHDDLICALALCTFWVRHRQRTRVQVGTYRGCF